MQWLDDDTAEAARREYREAHGEEAKPNGRDDPTPSRFRFLSFDRIELDTRPTFIVDGLLPRLGVAVVWGEPKSGKTFWTFDLEMHVALGWPYRGRRVEHGVVAHIACEGVAGLGARKAAWRRYHLDQHGTEALDEARLYLCKETALDLIADAETVASAIAAQLPEPLRIITIDTLNRSLRGSESKDEDMTAYLRAAVALAERFQCCVIVVHHCGYDASHPRGHTALIGGADADIKVSKDADGLITAAVQRMRDGPDDAEEHSRLHVVEISVDDNFEPIRSCVIVPAEVAQGRHTKARRLPDAAKVALDTLRRAIAADGMPAPTSNHVPAAVSGVDVETWRAFFYAWTSADCNASEQGQSNATKKKAFQRARQQLQAAGYIGLFNDFCWIAE